jgi:vacuolar-type H+-ATPase subunit H
MTPPTNHVFGTLVNPDGIPLVRYDIGTIHAAAGKLHGLGGDVRTAGVDINSTWQRLGGSYKAPETPTLLAATAPIAGRAAGYASKIEQAGRVLAGFAGEMPGHLRKLEQVRGQAVAFVGWAHAQPDGNWQEGRYDNSLGSAYNEALAGWIADAVKAIEDCEKDYGSQMARLVDTSLLPAPTGPRHPNAVEPHDPDRLHGGGDWRDTDLTKWGLPWGGPMTQAQIYDTFGKPSAFQNFLGNFLKNYYLAPLSMAPFVGINVNTDGGTGDDIHPHPKAGDFGWHVMSSAWGGAGKVVLAAVPLTDLMSSKLHHMNVKTRTAFLDSFLDRKNPSLAGRAGTITGNLLGLVTPSPADGVVADLAGTGAHLAEHGASFGTRLAGHALQAPEWLASGKFVGADFRLAGAGIRRLADHAGLTMPSMRQIVFPHPEASVLDPLTSRAEHAADGAVHAPTAADHRRAADETMLQGVRERQAILADGAERSRNVLNAARDQATQVQVDAQRRANEIMQQTVREQNRLIAAGDYAGAARARDAGAAEYTRISAQGRETGQQIYADAKHRSDAIMDEASRRAAQRRDQYLKDYLGHAQDYRKAVLDGDAAAAQQRAAQVAAAGSVHGGGHPSAAHGAGEPFLPRPVRAAWNGLPESTRDGILSIVRYENGPAATAGGMPGDWLLGPDGQSPGDQGTTQQVAMVLDYLKRHPQAARDLGGLDPANLDGTFVIKNTP